jgi:hypothetical protein
VHGLLVYEEPESPVPAVDALPCVVVEAALMLPYFLFYPFVFWAEEFGSKLDVVYQSGLAETCLVSVVEESGYLVVGQVQNFLAR